MAKLDLHQQITDQLVAAIEAGTKPWACPWAAAGGSIVPVRANGTPYRGINVLLLWAAADLVLAEAGEGAAAEAELIEPNANAAPPQLALAL